MNYLCKMFCLFLAVTFCETCMASYTLTAKDVIFQKGVIKKYIGKEKDIVIPDNFNGEPVRTIGGWAFRGAHLQNVIIPTSVRTIARSAFRGNNLTILVIPEG